MTDQKGHPCLDKDHPELSRAVHTASLRYFWNFRSGSKPQRECYSSRPSLSGVPSQLRGFRHVLFRRLRLCIRTSFVTSPTIAFPRFPIDFELSARCSYEDLSY